MHKKILSIFLVFLLTLSITSPAEADWRERIFGGLERLGEKYREWRKDEEIKKSLDLIRNEFQIPKTEISDDKLVKVLKSPDPQSMLSTYEVLKTKSELIEYGEILSRPATFPEPSVEKELAKTWGKLALKGGLEISNVPAGIILDIGSASEGLVGIVKILIEDRKNVVREYSENMKRFGNDTMAWKQTVETMEPGLTIRLKKQPEEKEKLHEWVKLAYIAIETFRNAEKEKEEIKKLILNRNEELNGMIKSASSNNIKNIHTPIAINEKPPGVIPASTSKDITPSKTALAPTDKLRGGDPHQNVTPVKDIPFTQTYIGTYEKPSSSPYNVATYTNTSPGSGTRTGVYPGSFTVNHSITATSTENNTFSSYSSGTFSASMSGTVSGLQGGKLKGTGNMNMTAGTSGGTNFNLSGPITIEPSGNLTSGTNGTFTLGGNSGTTTGTWVQTPK